MLQRLDLTRLTERIGASKTGVLAPAGTAARGHPWDRQCLFFCVPTLLTVPPWPLLPPLLQNKDLALPQHSDRAHKLLADNDTTVHMSYDVRWPGRQVQPAARAGLRGQSAGGRAPANPCDAIPVAGLLRRRMQHCSTVSAALQEVAQASSAASAA